MSGGKITRFQNNVRIDGDLDLSNSTGNLTFSSLSSAPSSPTVGDVYYDSSLAKVRAYQATGWTNVDGSAAASLDAAYNGGATITVDGGAITLTDSQTDTSGGLLITKSGAVTGSDDASVLHINSTGAHDTSGTLKFLEISVGAETASTIIGVEIEMNANGDDAILLTKGAMTITDGALTLSSGNFDVTGTATISSTLNVSGTSTLAAISNSGTLTSQGKVIIDIDDAEAFLIRENGDAADVFVVDTTQDVGDTSVEVESKTTTGFAFRVDADTTTGAAVMIDADAVTTGDALRISVASGTMGATGSAISVIDSTNADVEVFAVRDDGTIYSKATAEGTTAFEVVTGDVLISDGDLTVAGGEVAFTSDSTTAGLVITNNTITTANAMVDVSSTSISDGALMRLNANTTAHDGEILELINAGDATSTAAGLSITMPSITTGAARGIDLTMVGLTTTGFGIKVTMDAITTGDMLYLDNGGDTLTAGSGFFINCNDDNASKFSVSKYGATVIAGTAAGTAAMTLSLGDLVITDTDTTTITSVNGTGSIVEIISDGAIGADKAVLEIDAAGTLNADGSLLRLSAENVTDTNSPFAMQIDCAATDMGAINIVTAPTTLSGIVVTTTGVLAADKAVMELVSNVSSGNADSAVLRLEQTHTGGVSTCLALKQDDIDIPFITFETTIGTGNALEEKASKTLTVTHFAMVDVEGVGTRYIQIGTIA